jgi:hypothetical protein
MLLMSCYLSRQLGRSCSDCLPDDRNPPTGPAQQPAAAMSP